MRKPQGFEIEGHVLQAGKLLTRGAKPLVLGNMS